MTHHQQLDLARFEALFRQLYAGDVAQLAPLSAIPGVRAVFRLRYPDGTNCILRAYASDGAVPDWLAGCGAATNQEWLGSRAATLVYLEAHGYPAPRLIRTRAGDLVGSGDGCCTLATSFIQGEAIGCTPHRLAQLGATLARLHNVPADVPDATRVGRSWWHAETAIPAILEQYDAIDSSLPQAWRATVEACRAALLAIQSHSDLPRAIVHGDAWVGNAIQIDDNTVALIDWEPSGLGLSALDLGRLLLYGHYDQPANLAQPIEPSAWRIAAIVEGYCQQRVPTIEERAVLADAIRFGVAVGAASHFMSVAQAGWPDLPPERLLRRRHWLAISDEIAEIAVRHMGMVSAMTH